MLICKQVCIYANGKIWEIKDILFTEKQGANNLLVRFFHLLTH